jgi:hypothetical protein
VRPDCSHPVQSQCRLLRFAHSSAQQVNTSSQTSTVCHIFPSVHPSHFDPVQRSVPMSDGWHAASLQWETSQAAALSQASISSQSPPWVHTWRSAPLQRRSPARSQNCDGMSADAGSRPGRPSSRLPQAASASPNTKVVQFIGSDIVTMASCRKGKSPESIRWTQGLVTRIQDRSCPLSAPENVVRSIRCHEPRF